MCATHYSRWQANGTLERTVPAGRNEYRVVDLITAELVITRRDGSEHVVTYDLADHDLVSGFRWYIANGYAVANYGPRRDHRRIFMHRLVLGLGSIADDPRLGDHMDGDRLNNRRDNLRTADHKLNSANRAIINEAGTSNYRGVCWDKSRGKWKAYTRVKGRMHNLGFFSSEEEAADTVIAYRALHHVDIGYLRRHPHTPTEGGRTA